MILFVAVIYAWSLPEVKKNTLTILSNAQTLQF